MIYLSRYIFIYAFAVRHDVCIDILKMSDGTTGKLMR